MTVKDILSKLTVDNLAGMKVILYDMNKWMPDGVEYDPKYFEYEVPMTLRGDWRLLPTKYSEYEDRIVYSISIYGGMFKISMK